MSAPGPLQIAFACPGCGASVEGALDPSRAALDCPACHRETRFPELGAATETSPPTGSPPPGPLPLACPVCGCAERYAIRDFQRGLGLLIAAVGLALGPFTHWISTVVAIGIDALLYMTVPPVAICYACNAQLRGFTRAEAPPGFEIAIHDAYKFGKRFPPRRENAVAGPLQTRLSWEKKGP